MDHAYAAVPELKLLKARGGKSSHTTVLMGAWLKVLEERTDGWLNVRAFGKTGWVHLEDVQTADGFLKIFFVDVGQGDGCLIEAPGRRLLVDAGQYARNMRNFLTKFKYKWLLQAGYQIHFDAVVISHFDADHFGGLASIISDTRFTFGKIYHNGIARFSKTKSKRPAKYDRHIGQTGTYINDEGEEKTLLRSSFNTIADAKKLLTDGGLMSTFRKFLEAAVTASDEGRLKGMNRVTARSSYLAGFAESQKLSIQSLGPVPLKDSGSVTYPWLKDDSHTINGHSVILRLNYGDRSFLLGGDLNTFAEEYLLNVTPTDAFKVDVAKACHHGASEFSVSFLEATNPYATIFSSGDNENYAHPRADALGSVGRYSRGKRPLIFSTELARSYKGAEKIHYGLVNCRSDGKTVVMAQMLEKAKYGDMWDAYELP
jgi:beta-lactamase superfamily II metal-dependent hydrolase